MLRLESPLSPGGVARDDREDKGETPPSTSPAPQRPARAPGGRREPPARPPLTVAQILAWADRHFADNGCWPNTRSGAVPGAPWEKWVNIDQALRQGLRGLPGGSSLARLLDRERGVRNIRDLPPLTEEQVLAWARGHRERSGSWPTEYSGPIPDTRGEVWANVDVALREGYRGLPGGDTLARLLARHLGGRPPRKRAVT